VLQLNASGCQTKRGKVALQPPSVSVERSLLIHAEILTLAYLTENRFIESTTQPNVIILTRDTGR